MDGRRGRVSVRGAGSRGGSSIPPRVVPYTRDPRRALTNNEQATPPYSVAPINFDQATTNVSTAATSDPRLTNIVTPTNDSLKSATTTTKLDQLIADIKSIKGAVNAIKDGQARIEANVKQLHKFVKEQEKQSFKISDTPYQVSLSRDARKSFCLSLRRELSSDEIHEIVTDNLGDEIKAKYKFEAAKSYIKQKFIEWRSEERRRLLGKRPCQAFIHYTTQEFASKFLKTMKVSDCDEEYYKNLAVMRKFLRTFDSGHTDVSLIYNHFRKWLDENFTQGIPTTAQWTEILAEDEKLDYEHNQLVIENHDDSDDLELNAGDHDLLAELS